jgi:hypothetical protein
MILSRQTGFKANKTFAPDGSRYQSVFRLVEEDLEYGGMVGREAEDAEVADLPAIVPQPQIKQPITIHVPPAPPTKGLPQLAPFVRERQVGIAFGECVVKIQHLPNFGGDGRIADRARNPARRKILRASRVLALPPLEGGLLPVALSGIPNGAGAKGAAPQLRGQSCPETFLRGAESGVERVAADRLKDFNRCRRGRVHRAVCRQASQSGEGSVHSHAPARTCLAESFQQRQDLRFLRVSPRCLGDLAEDSLEEIPQSSSDGCSGQINVNEHAVCGVQHFAPVRVSRDDGHLVSLRIPVLVEDLLPRRPFAVGISIQPLVPDQALQR